MGAGVVRLRSVLALGLVPCLAGALACRTRDGAGPQPVASATDAGATVAPVSPLARWVGGDSYTYRVELSSTSQNESAPSAIAFVAKAALRLKPQPSAAGTELFAELLDVSVESVGDAGAPLPPSLLDDLARPWGFELVGGRFRAVRVAPKASPFAIGILDTLAAGLQSPPAAPEGGPWEHVEADSTGTYRARYAPGASPGEIVRVQVAYDDRALSSSPFAFGQLRSSPTVVASQGTLRLRGDDLAAVRTHEELEASLTLASKVRSTTDLTLTLVDHGSGQPAPDWAALRGATVVLEPGRLPPQPDVDPYGRELAQGVTFAQALAAVDAESTPAPGSSADPLASSAPDEDTARARQKTFATLVAVLRYQPGSVPLAKAALDKGARSRPVLLDALGAAETPEALSALVDYVRRADVPPDVRKKAAFSLIRTPRPNAAAVDALVSLLDDPLLRSYAVLGLGTYSRRLREGGDVAGGQRAVDAIAARLDAAKTRQERIEILQGIANSGDGRELERVRPSLDDPDESVKAAAVDAIRLMPNPEVDALVAARMAPGERVPVRLEAIDAARLRGAREPMVSSVRDAALHAGDAESRLKAVTLLKRWLPDHPELRATLEDVAKNDAREAVRRAAKAALGT